MTNKPKSAEMIPGPGFMVRKSIDRLPAAMIARFESFATADISDSLNRMYTLASSIENVTTDERLMGSACTVKVFPGDNLMVHKALDVAKPGDVIVVDTSGNRSNAVIGDLVLTKAKHRGIAGFVVDGLVRDVEAMREVGIPVYARGITPFGPLHRGPGELNYSVSCGGVVVNPGDLIVADGDGVVVVRKEYAEVVAQRLEDTKERMAAYLAAVQRGDFSNDWVDQLLELSECPVND